MRLPVQVSIRNFYWRFEQTKLRARNLIKNLPFQFSKPETTANLEFGTVLHEFGHIVGFWHEHTRPDRDENVAIIYKNIQEDQLHNFDKMNKSEIDSLGSPYDFESIMHYSRNTFSKDQHYLDTVKPMYKTTGATNDIGQRVRLSKQDIKQANLLYKCPINGQTIQQSRGLLEFNEYADLNKIESDQYYYEWRFVASSLSEHYMLKIEEINFNSFDDLNCDHNYLLILDGYTASSPVVQRLCPTTSVQLPFELHSKTNRMLIIYKKSKQNRSGNLVFKSYYEVQCGGQLISPDGIIQSPNYPLAYPPLSNCQWTIQVERNHKILLDFIRFDLENNSNCLTDYVEIRDGLHETSRLIGKFCDDRLRPNRIQSSSNEMYIRFVSDSVLQKTGFNVTYTTDLDECEQNLHNCEQICINTLNGYKCDCMIGFELDRDERTCVKSCGGVIQVMNNEIRTLTSPGYPNEYENFLNCKWELRAPPNYSIFVNFTDFDLEENSHCESDTLTIKSRLAEENSLVNHGRYCGGLIAPSPILSKSSTLLIDFKSKFRF